MNNQSSNSSVWSDLKYGFKTYFVKPPHMHRGVYWARRITFIFIGMVIYFVAQDLIACECHCEYTLSTNAGLEDSGLSMGVNTADESRYFSAHLVEVRSSSLSTFEVIS